MKRFYQQPTVKVTTRDVKNAQGHTSKAQKKYTAKKATDLLQAANQFTDRPVATCQQVATSLSILSSLLKSGLLQIVLHSDRTKTLQCFNLLKQFAVSPRVTLLDNEPSTTQLRLLSEGVKWKLGIAFFLGKWDSMP